MLGSQYRRVAPLFAAICIVTIASPALSVESLDLPALIDKVEPAVVRINVKGSRGEGHGSGFVVDADGIVVTNHHVIAGAEEATAIFANKETVKVLGTLWLDKKRDIAVLKIEKTGLPVLQLAKALPRKGETCVACGAPIGLDFSYSDGIVSGIRSGKEAAVYIGEEVPGQWLQITAPVSPGNSGGPLVNREGEVLGANTMASLGGGAQNINFSISCLDIAEVLQQATKKNQLLALSDGAAKSKHERPKAKRNEIAAEKIPKEKIESYIKSAKDSYKDAKDDARRKMADAKKRLTEMKSGRVGTLAAQAGQTMIIHDRGKQVYQYPSEETKTRTVKKQTDEARTAEEYYTKIQDPKNGMIAYLTKSGPETELKEVGDIGCVAEIHVGPLLESDEFLGFLMQDNERMPITVRGIETSKLATGHNLSRRLMYVCGMQQVGSREGTLNLRVLREVPEDILSKHLETLGISSPSSEAAKTKPDGKSTEKPIAAAPSKSGEPELRIWTAKSGHKIEAMLVEKTADKVVLKRKDGQTVSVPLAVLSQADLDLLKAVPEAKAK